MHFILPLLAAFISISLTYGSSNGKIDSQGVATCKKLQSALGSTVVLSGPEYDARASGAWNLYNAQSFPACIVLPIDASHVQIAMKAIYQDKIRYAVQAGGHSAMKGWNTCVTCPVRL
jgi:hypothetical protein